MTSIKKTEQKFYSVTIDLIDSFNCEIQADSEEEALKKAEKIALPQENNVPHFSRTEVIGIDGEPYYD